MAVQRHTSNGGQSLSRVSSKNKSADGGWGEPGGSCEGPQQRWICIIEINININIICLCSFEVLSHTFKPKTKAHWLQGFIKKKFGHRSSSSPPHCLCRLPPSFSLFFLLYPQTLSSVFPLLRWVIPRQNNGLLCFIELPLSFSHLLFSFPPFICRALSLFRSLFSFLLSSQFWEDCWLKWRKWREGGSKKEWAWVKDAGFCMKRWRKKGGW